MTYALCKKLEIKFVTNLILISRIHLLKHKQKFYYMCAFMYIIMQASPFILMVHLCFLCLNFCYYFYSYEVYVDLPLLKYMHSEIWCKVNNTTFCLLHTVTADKIANLLAELYV